MESRYWATAPRDDLAGEMEDRIKRYYSHLDESGRIEVWRQALRTYYGLDNSGQWARSAAVQYGGEQGELVMQRANHWRSLAEHTLVLATASRPAFSCRTVNSDYKSQIQAKLGEGLIDYYLTELGMESDAKDGLERGIVLSEGWLYVAWDPNGGEPHMTEERPIPEHAEQYAAYMEAADAYQSSVEEAAATGAGYEGEEPTTDGIEFYDHVTYQGDVIAEVLSPLDVIRDVNASDIHALRWHILRRPANKWDLAAQYPEARQEIEDTSIVISNKEILWDYTATSTNEDDVFTYHLFHDRTPAVPQGRHAILCGDTILFDGPLPYDGLPVRAMCPAKEMGTPFGYSRMWDCLPLQEGMNAALSTIATNHDALGMSNIYVGPGGGFEMDNLDGLRIFEGDTKPEVIDLSQADENSYKLFELYQRTMETLSGINGVARGEPQASLKSGSALALVHSMAMQYNSGVQQTYGEGLEWMMGKLLEVLRTYATTPRIAEIAGKRSKPHMRQFTGDDIGALRRVKVELGNALMRTTAGRKEIADKLLEMQVITPEQYLDVLSTGRLDPVLAGPAAQRGLVDQENEQLLSSDERVIALFTDNHALHIGEHLVLLAEPDIRRDNAAVAKITAHVDEHLKFQNPQPQQAPAGPPQAGAPPAGGGQPQPIGAEVTGVTDNPNGIGPDAKLPNMPENPMTGQPVDPSAMAGGAL